MVVLLTAIVAGMHWTAIGNVPLIEALQRTDNIEVQALRHAANEVPSWINYMENLVVKALLPFTLLLTWRRHPRLFVALAVVGSVYALSLLQKSLIITLYVPLWVSFIIARRWRMFATLTALFLVVIGVLLIVAKPEKLVQAREGSSDAAANAPVLDEGVKEHGLVLDLLWRTTRRVLLTPGYTVAAWFEHIPADVPFLHGGAVRPLAKVTGHPFIELDRRIYDLEYPEYAALHTQGTMGSASFMYGWANYGGWGLVASGVITALALWFFGSVYGDRWRWALCLNTFPLLALSAVALPTVLLTHGWAVTTLLFVLFAPPDEPTA
jgi:hypothetical protein